jgi:hypothetical protein
MGSEAGTACLALPVAELIASPSTGRSTREAAR